MTENSNPGPQVEDGHTRIANELLEAMCRAGFSARQWAVVMAVVRKTYGYGKKADDISLGQLEGMTGIAKPHASRAVNDLIAAGVLRRSAGTFGNSLSLNKRYKQWAVGAPREVTESVTQELPKEQLGLPKQQPLDGVTDLATQVTDSVTTNGVAELVTGGTESVRVTESVTQGLPNRQPQKETIQKKEKHSRTILSDGTGDGAELTRHGVGADEPSPEFMAAWSIYPKRMGGNPRKMAWKAWKARLRAGEATSQELVDATRGYAKFCDSEHKTGTQYVLMASTFYGSGEPWREWLPKAADASGEGSGARPWYALVGFSNQWEAENAGCTEGNRWMWENRQQVRTEQDWPAWKASQAEIGRASA